MEKWLYLKLIVMAGCFLVSTGVPGFAFVTPEHYEKLKQEARIKEKAESKADLAVPGTIQVHPPADSKPVPAGSTKK
jgi:hypothetical protein